MPALNDSLHAAAEDGDIDALNQFLANGEPRRRPRPRGTNAADVRDSRRAGRRRSPLAQVGVRR